MLGGALARRDGPALDKALAAVIIAGAANAVNLLDLRPGRAIKGAAIAAGPGVLRRALSGGAARNAGPGAGSAGAHRAAANTLAGAGLGAALALLPEDLGESAMLGDAGANALGALLGTASAFGARSTAALAWRAAAVTAVNLASERFSFTKVIAACPPLDALDTWGRRPAGPPRVPAQGPAAARADDEGRADRSAAGPDARG